MRFIQFLERKFKRYAIPNLMKYIIALYGVGFLYTHLTQMHIYFRFGY